MKLKQTVGLIWMFLLLSALAFPRTASAEGLYLQAELGRYFVDERLNVSSIGTRIDGSAKNLRILVGYDFNDYFGVEAAYIDFRTVTASAQGVSVSANADGRKFGLVGRLPVFSGLDLNFRGGFLWWDGDANAGVAIANKSGRDFYYGIGVEYLPADRFGVGVNLTKYDLDGIDLIGMTIGLRVKF